MTYIQERGSTHVYHVNRMSKEEMDHMISLCVHEQPAYCVAACPFKMDTKEMLYYAAKGNFKKALAIYEKITPFPMILCDGCTAPCEDNCKLCELGDGVSIREVDVRLSASNAQRVSPLGEAGWAEGDLLDVELLRGEEFVDQG